MRIRLAAYRLHRVCLRDKLRYLQLHRNLMKFFILRPTSQTVTAVNKQTCFLTVSHGRLQFWHVLLYYQDDVAPKQRKAVCLHLICVMLTATHHTAASHFDSFQLHLQNSSIFSEFPVKDGATEEAPWGNNEVRRWNINEVQAAEVWFLLGFGNKCRLRFQPSFMQDVHIFELFCKWKYCDRIHNIWNMKQHVSEQTDITKSLCGLQS